MVDYLDKVSSLIEEANNKQDLLNILSSLPLQLIKDAVQNAFSTIDIHNTTAKQVYFKAASLSDIIPSDVIQSILSFNSLSLTQKCVNKTFKSLTEKNESMQTRKRNDFVNEYEFDRRAQ